MARKLIVELIADPRGYTAGLEKAAASTKLFGREVDQMTRGIASGTGVMHSFGRSLAFASGGFIAFAGVSKFLDDSVKSAIDAGVAQRSLTAQMKASGESFTASSDEIEKANLGLAKFGFTSEDAVHALTVLERGTGNIRRALSLETVSADLARAKNIDLASAANVVAKVFGGQETALRRAVPGLDKTAHGMDLVREAQQRLAGQAAAATTPGEQFNATLHDTEVILGTALLPKLNTGLGYLTEWLNNVNQATDNTDGFAGSIHRLAERLGELGDNAATAGHDTKSAWDQIPDVFQQALFGILGKGGGGIGAFAALTNALGGAVTSGFRAVGLGSLVRQPRPAGGGNLFSPGFQLPSFGLPTPPPFIPHDLPAGQAAAPILGRGALTPAQRNQLALSSAALTRTTTDDLKALVTQRQLLAKAIRTETGRLNQATTADAAKRFADNLRSLQDKDAAAMSQIVSLTKKGASDAGKTSAELAGQRNTWFDSSVSRMLDRVQDIPAVQGQIARLKQIAGLIQQRIDATRDVTRKLNLEDTLAQVNRTITGDRAQVVQNRKDAAQARKDAAQAAADRKAAAQQNRFDLLQLAVDQTDLTKTSQDNLKALRRYRAVVEQTIKTEGSTLQLQQTLLSIELAINAKNQEIADNRKQAAEKEKEAAAKERAAEKASAQHAADRVAAVNKRARLQETNISALNQIVRKQRAAAVTARNAEQFRALGLTATGQQRTPGVEALQRRLEHLRTVISPHLFTSIAGILAEGINKVGEPVRAAIDQIFDTYDAKLKQRSQGTLKGFRHVSAQALVDSLGVGLTPGQRRRLVAGVASFGPGLSVHTGHTPAFAAHTTVINGGVHLHDVQNVPAFENELAKRAGGRGHVRRGAR